MIFCHPTLPSPAPLSHWVCCNQYLQEWNKVVLFQVITARLGQEVHELGSVIVTGLQSPGKEKKEQMVARLHSYSLHPFFLEFFHKHILSVFIIDSEIRMLNGCLVIESVKCYGDKGEICICGGLSFRNDSVMRSSQRSGVFCPRKLMH